MITVTVMKELKKKVKSSPALAKKGGLRKTCREKLYQELESLKITEEQRRYRKLCCLFKIPKTKFAKQLFRIFSLPR